VQVGDLLLCYTDGVIDSSDSEGRQLGERGLQEILDSLPVEPAERILPELVGRIAERGRAGLHEDDVTILLYRISGRPIPMRDNLAAPWRWLNGLFARN
jgi:serine phosphatase RsbU (regulator of sigma subunit)